MAHIPGNVEDEHGAYEAEKESSGTFEYYPNGMHVNAESNQPGDFCCSCCFKDGERCPQGYTDKGDDEDGNFLGCEKAAGGVAGMWRDQMAADNGKRCYCGCCPCYESTLHFSILHCRIEYTDDNGASYEDVCDNKDGWEFSLEQNSDTCYTNQERALRGYINPCSQEKGGADNQAIPPSESKTFGGGCEGNAGSPFFWWDNLTPEYTDPAKKSFYQEAYSFQSSICAGDALPERPAFGFDGAGSRGGMQVIASLCCCRTGNKTPIPDLPVWVDANDAGKTYNQDREIPDLDEHICNAEVDSEGEIKSNCPGTNTTLEKTSQVTTHVNGLEGYARQSFKEAAGGEEWRFNSICGSSCNIFTLYPDPVMRMPVSFDIHQKFNNAVDQAACDAMEEGWSWIPAATPNFPDGRCIKQWWEVGGSCTPCSQALMKYYIPPAEANKPNTPVRQDTACNSLLAGEWNELQKNWLWNNDHPYNQSSMQTVTVHKVKAMPAHPSSELGVSPLVHGQCLTKNAHYKNETGCPPPMEDDFPIDTKFIMTVTGSFSISCDCQTGYLRHYKWPGGDPYNSDGSPHQGTIAGWEKNADKTDPDAAPGDVFACTNCAGESLGLPSRTWSDVQDGNCAWGFHRMGDICWPSSDYQSAVRLYFMGEISE